MLLVMIGQVFIIKNKLLSLSNIYLKLIMYINMMLYRFNKVPKKFEGV